ncbi:hypothetical protein FRB90_009451 [Tulasnella sp. 427]|nr:hypothetical protein FRB90_009451 [Tulasnella sp. 427]
MAANQSMRAIIVKDGKGPIENLLIGNVPKPQLTLPGSEKEDIPFLLGQLRYLESSFQEQLQSLDPTSTASTKEMRSSGLPMAWGAYAEYVLVDAGMLLPKLPKLSWEHAAAIPEAWLTAYQALVKIANIEEGDNILIHAGASGVGIAAIQLARLFKANHVVATAGSPEKLEFLKSMPLAPTDAVNYKTEDFSKRVGEITSGKGVDVIVDFIAQDYWNKNIASLALDGRMVLLATLGGGSMPPGAEITPILYKRLRIQGSTLRSRSQQYQVDLIQGFKRDVLDTIEGCNSKHGEEGHLRIYVHKVYKWDGIQDAHREMEQNKNSGKIIVQISQS